MYLSIYNFNTYFLIINKIKLTSLYIIVQYTKNKKSLYIITWNNATIFDLKFLYRLRLCPSSLHRPHFTILRFTSSLAEGILNFLR